MTSKLIQKNLQQSFLFLFIFVFYDHSAYLQIFQCNNLFYKCEFYHTRNIKVINLFHIIIYNDYIIPKKYKNGKNVMRKNFLYKNFANNIIYFKKMNKYYLINLNCFEILSKFAIINTTYNPPLIVLRATTQKSNIINIIFPIHNSNNFLHIDTSYKSLVMLHDQHKLSLRDFQTMKQIKRKPESVLPLNDLAVFDLQQFQVLDVLFVVGNAVRVDQTLFEPVLTLTAHFVPVAHQQLPTTG